MGSAIAAWTTLLIHVRRIGPWGGALSWTPVALGNWVHSWKGSVSVTLVMRAAAVGPPGWVVVTTDSTPGHPAIASSAQPEQPLSVRILVFMGLSLSGLGLRAT